MSERERDRTTASWLFLSFMIPFPPKRKKKGKIMVNEKQTRKTKNEKEENKMEERGMWYTRNHFLCFPHP